MAIVLRIKKQSARGTPATGSGSFEIRMRPGQGMQRTAATIARTILDRSGMKAKDRQGSITASFTGDTEIEARNMAGVFGGVLGGDEVAALSLSQADFTSLTISGTGTLLTFGGGSLYSLGVRVGMLIKLGSMATAGNNGVWVPVLTIPSATTLTIPSGYLVDETIDSSFTLVSAPYNATPTPRPREFFTVEAYDDAKDLSKLLTDARFTNLQISIAANQTATVTFGLTGLDLQPLGSGSSPNFSDPGATQGEALLLLDGALYRNGVAVAALTSMNLGLQANAVVTPLATSRVGADVGVSQFAFQATINEEVDDYAALQSAIDEDRIELFMILANRAAPTEIVAIYAGNCSYAQANDQVSDDDREASTQQATLYGGKDTRGTAVGYAVTSLLISRTVS